MLLAVAPAAAETPFRATHAAQGVAATLEISAVSGGRARAGEPALLRLRFASGDDPAGLALRGLRPAAWAEREGALSITCRERVHALLQPRIGLRAEVDFNAWHLASLSDNGALHVLDPLGGNGRSRLLTLVNLGGQAGGFAADAARDAAYASVPSAGEVVEIDTLRWMERRRIATGGAPGMLLPDPDGVHLWVGSAAGGSEVLRLDRASGEIQARIPAGEGPHVLAPLGAGIVLAASPAGASLLSDGTATPLPGLGNGFTAAAWSPLAELAVLLDTGAGRLLAVTPDGRPTAVWPVSPDATGIFLDPSGRLALVPEPGESQVTVVDLARGAVAHRIALPDARPLRIGFSRTNAYVQSAEGTRIAVVSLASLGESTTPSIAWIAAGESGLRRGEALGDLITPSPDETTMLIADPGVGLVHVYTEGMAGPTGGLRLPPVRPLALLAVDRALREVSPGLHEAVAIFPRQGPYVLPVMLQGGGFLHCFTVEVEGDEPPPPLAERLGFELAEEPQLAAGAPASLRLRLRGPVEAANAWAAAPDLQARLVQFAGHWQEVLPLRPLGQGLYAADGVTPPRDGPVLLHLESKSLGLQPGTLPHLTLHAETP